MIEIKINYHKCDDCKKCDEIMKGFLKQCGKGRFFISDTFLNKNIVQIENVLMSCPTGAIDVQAV